MTRNLLRAGALSCALLTTTALTMPAQAQTPRQHRNLDANGVDLTHGDFVMAVPEGSIGSGDAELPLIRSKIGSGDGSAHASRGPHQWDNIFLEQNVLPGGGVRTTVVRDGRFEQFNPTGSSPTGSTLTNVGGDYHYRLSDGTTIIFSVPVGQVVDGSYCTGFSSCTLLPSAITSPDGKTVTIEWDLWTSCEDRQSPEDPFVCTHWGRIAGVSNSFGYQIAFSYASQGTGGINGSPPPNTWQRRTGATFHNSAVGSAAQSSVSYAYPSTGVVEVTDIGGRVWRFTGTAATISGIRRPGAAADTISVTQAGNGQVSSVTREGVTTSYARSVSGTTATMTVTNALSQQTTIVSDMTIGRPTSVTDALTPGRTTSYQYDGNARLTRVTKPEGNYVQYTLDARGNATQTQAVAKSGSGLAAITTSASYDATCSNPVTCNSPNSITDARGNVTNYSYDPTHGGVTSVLLPAPSGSGDRPETRYSYTLTNGEHRLTGISACSTGTAPSCVGTANETRTVIAYDSNGNVTSTEQRDGTGALVATTAMTYDPRGDLLTVDGPLAGAADTTRTRYNAARQAVGVIGPDPDGGGARKHRATRTTYVDGRPTTFEQGTVNSQSDGDWAAFAALEAVEQTYDANARPTVQRLTSGGTTYALTQTSYDALGRVECTAQRMNPAEFASLPASACTLDTQGSHGPDRIGRTTYDAAGQVTLVQSAYGVTGQQADELAATYRTNGQIETLTDAEGNRTTYEYDGHDRLAKTRYPSATTDGVSSTTDYEHPGYDANGNVTSLRLRDGQSIALTYDTLNRLTFKNVPNVAPYEFDVTYTYDLLGRLSSATDSGTHFAIFGYDALGRKVSEQSNWTTRAWQYDLAGRRSRLTWGDGFYVTYDSDTAGNMIAIRENGAASGIGVLATFAYDDLGRRTSLTRGNGTVTSYAYDPVSRLGSLAHDFAGTTHDLAVGFTYNPASQIATNSRSNDLFAKGGHANIARAETVNGLNQLTAQGATGLTYDGRGNVSTIGAASYGYTSENRLASAPGGYVMTYDPLGRYHWIATGAQTWMQYDGADIIEERTSGGVARRYVHGPGTDEPLVWYEGSSTTDRRWLHADERGSIIAVSNASGAVTNINTYDEYGVPAGANTGRFQYTGQAWLPELGMYHYKARTYNPLLGRFTQADNLQYIDGMNRYTYVSADPVNLIDPTGMCTATWDNIYKGFSDGSMQFIGSENFKLKNCGISSGGGGSSGGFGPIGNGGGGMPADDQPGTRPPINVARPTASCRANSKFMSALAGVEVQFQVGQMLGMSLNYLQSGNLAEYGFINDTSSALTGPLFTSGLRRTILSSAMLGPDGSRVSQVKSSLPDWIYFHSHPNYSPSPISTSDQKVAEYFGLTVAAVDKNGYIDCYSG